MTSSMARGLFKTFSAAATRAREVSVRHGLYVQVKRCSEGWEVSSTRSTEEPSFSEAATGPNEDDSEYREYLNEIDEELGQELEDDREDWARCEEEGWYYDDEDGDEDGDGITPSEPEGHDTQFGRFQAPRDAYGRTLPTGSSD